MRKFASVTLTFLPPVSWTQLPSPLTLRTCLVVLNKDQGSLRSPFPLNSSVPDQVRVGPEDLTMDVLWGTTSVYKLDCSFRRISQTSLPEIGHVSGLPNRVFVDVTSCRSLHAGDSEWYEEVHRNWKQLTTWTCLYLPNGNHFLVRLDSRVNRWSERTPGTNRCG